MECETKGCNEMGNYYDVAWRLNGIYFCKKHSEENKGLLKQGVNHGTL